MEKLRKIFRRLGRANEKVVFALMVAVLIWRVVQIVIPKDDVGGYEKRVDILPIEADPREPMTSSQQDPARYANVDVAAWRIPGPGVVPDNTGEDVPPNMPAISCTGTQEVGTGPNPSIWAKVQVDGKSATVKPGSSFARRQATLDEIDTDRGVIVFTWVANGKKYERRIGG